MCACMCVCGGGGQVATCRLRGEAWGAQCCQHTLTINSGLWICVRIHACYSGTLIGGTEYASQS